MRRINLVTGTAAVALMLNLGGPVAARVETLKGTLIDKACYERDPRNAGQKHVDRPIDECAKACAKYGLPVAVLTPDGKVYQVTGELAAKRNAQLVPHMTHTVEITGDVTTDDDGGLRIAGTSVKMVGK